MQEERRTLHIIVFNGGERAAYLFDDATYAQMLADQAARVAVGSYDVATIDGDPRLFTFRFADVATID
jgi:hypothetical protein